MVRTLFFLLLVPALSAPADEFRVTKDLQVLYDFADTRTDQIADRSGAGAPLPLFIEDVSRVRRLDGQLQILKPVILRTKESPTRLIHAIKRSEAVTLEAWVATRNTKQEGPARVVTLSQSPTNRNITLGQEFSAWDVRLRTTKTNSNGIPSLSAPKDSVQTRMTHIVYTHAKDGWTRIYIDGQQVAERRVGGSLSAWRDDYTLAIGDEVSGGRAWLGTIDLVAILIYFSTCRIIIP